MGMFTNAFAGFQKLKSTGEIESDFPKGNIIQNFSLEYKDNLLGKVKLSLILLKDGVSTLSNRAVLSIANQGKNEVYTLARNVVSLGSINRPEKNDSQVIEIDLQKMNKIIELNLLPLANQKGIYNEIVKFDEQGYRR